MAFLPDRALALAYQELEFERANVRRGADAAGTCPAHSRPRAPRGRRPRHRRHRRIPRAFHPATLRPAATVDATSHILGLSVELDETGFGR